MKQFFKSTLMGFLGTLISGTLLAIVILQPLFNKDFGIYVRTVEQGLNFPSLTSGYLVLGVVMSMLYPRLTWNLHWVQKGLIFGFAFGLAVFFGGHLIVAGWSTIPAQPMILSGFVDAFSGAVGGVCVAYGYKGATYHEQH